MPFKTVKTIICKYWKFFWSIVGPIITIIGFLLAIYTLRPILSINAPASLDMANPSKIPFIIKNEGLIPIYDISMIFNILDLEGINIKGHNFSLEKCTIPRTYKTIKGGKSVTNFFGLPIKSVEKIKKAEIELVITYKMPLIPKSFSESFKYISLQGSDNVVHLLPVP